MGNRLIVALGLGIALSAAACGDDDNNGKNPPPDGSPAPDAGGNNDAQVPNIDSGMDAQTPGPDAVVVLPDGNVVPAPTDGQVPGPDGNMMPPQGTVSKRITAAGGTITSADGNLTLTITQGVLPRPIDVTITQVTQNLPAGVRGGVAYRIDPPWEAFQNLFDNRQVKVQLRYTPALLGGQSAGDLQLGRFESGGWIELANAGTYVSPMNVTYIRGDLQKFGTVAFFTGVCEACRETACTIGEPCAIADATAPGVCRNVGGCNVCRPPCDVDGDGVCEIDVGGGFRGGDCAPNDPNIYPGATELCNGVNDNCDQTTDEGCTECKLDSECPTNWSCQQGACRPCSIAPGCATAGGSCTFGFETTFTGRCAPRGPAGSVCTECVPTCDADGDRYCPPGSPPQGQEMGNDCADMNPSVNPRGVEVCGDDLDNDCDGKVNNGCAECQTDATCPAGNSCVGNACIACTEACTGDAMCPGGRCVRFGMGCSRCAAACDGDGDGYCMNPQGDTPGGDRDDNDPTVSPGLIEICNNNKDDDSDGYTDENCKPCTMDMDCPQTGMACLDGVCIVCEGGYDPMQRFGATEQNPDGGVPAAPHNYGRGCVRGVPSCDVDKDGFCDANKMGGVPNHDILGADCDDMDPKINKSAPEVCGNMKDDDCDGQTDENCEICETAMMCTGANRHCSSNRPAPAP